MPAILPPKSWRKAHSLKHSIKPKGWHALTTSEPAASTFRPSSHASPRSKAQQLEDSGEFPSLDGSHRPEGTHTNPGSSALHPATGRGDKGAGHQGYRQPGYNQLQSGASAPDSQPHQPRRSTFGQGSASPAGAARIHDSAVAQLDDVFTRMLGEECPASAQVLVVCYT